MSSSLSVEERYHQMEEVNLRNDSGFEAYLVGGCVRDTLLNLVPHDWDITTNALPEQVRAVFERFIVIPTGLKHGTVTVSC